MALAGRGDELLGGRALSVGELLEDVLVRRGCASLREPRLRAGLSQQELADRSGKERTVIARWEQGSVSPSFDTVIELVRARFRAVARARAI